MPELDKNDLDIINKIIMTTISIDKKYRELCYLELNGKKDSDDYKNNIVSLKDLLVEEAIQYADEYLTQNKLEELINYLLSKEASIEDFALYKRINIKLNSQFDVFFLKLDNNTVMRRILCKLRNKVFFDRNISGDDIPELLIKLLGALSGEDNRDNIIESIKKDIVKSSDIYKYLESDFLQMFLCLLEEYKKNPKYADIFNDLTIIKYMVALTGSVIEKDLLGNDFNISDTVYFSSKMFFDTMGITQKIFDLARENFGFTEANYQISQLLSLNNKENGAIPISRQCLLKSALLLLNDSMIDKAKKDFFTYDERHSNLKKQGVNSFGRAMVVSSFFYINDDREKQKVISFDPKFKIN